MATPSMTPNEHSFDLDDGYCHTHRAHCSMASARADDPLAEVKVGDPRPEWHYQRGCGEASPRDYVCTRQQGHPGQHIATTPDRVVDVWPQGGAA